MIQQRLAVVGSTDLTDDQTKDATWLVECILRSESPRLTISGGAPGIDTVAWRVALRGHHAFKVYYPDIHVWDGVGGQKGFKQRNIQIAEACDAMVCIRSRQSTTNGSGWTADYAESLGKVVRRLWV